MKIAIQKKGYTNMCLNRKNVCQKRCDKRLQLTNVPNPTVWTLNITKINPKYRQKLAFH